MDGIKGSDFSLAVVMDDFRKRERKRDRIAINSFCETLANYSPPMGCLFSQKKEERNTRYSKLKTPVG